VPIGRKGHLSLVDEGDWNLARRSGPLGGASFAANRTTSCLMGAEEDAFRRGQGPSLMRPLILAALIGVGTILTAIGTTWLMMR